MDDGPLAAEPVHPTVGMVNIRSQVDNTPDASRAWEECANQVWAREEMLVKKWKDEISNLLTFVSIYQYVHLCGTSSLLYLYGINGSADFSSSGRSLFCSANSI